jgi:hypothetical protein
MGRAAVRDFPKRLRRQVLDTELEYSPLRVELVILMRQATGPRFVTSPYGPSLVMPQGTYTYVDEEVAVMHEPPTPALQAAVLLGWDGRL